MWTFLILQSLMVFSCCLAIFLPKGYYCADKTKFVNVYKKFSGRFTISSPEEARGEGGWVIEFFCGLEHLYNCQGSGLNFKL